MKAAIGMLAAVAAAALMTAANASRSYVPPACRAALDTALAKSVYDPAPYRECVLRLMGVVSAEARVANGETAYRVLAEIGTLAIPVFVEFVRSTTGSVTLDVGSPTPGNPHFTRAVGAQQWRAIETR
jgi:hypothetical protein